MGRSRWVSCFFLLDKHHFHCTGIKKSQLRSAACYAIHGTIARGKLNGLDSELTRRNGWQREESHSWWSACNTASSYGSEILILHPGNHEPGFKSIRLLNKRGVCVYRFLGLLGYLELLGGTLSHSQHFSETLTKTHLTPKVTPVKPRVALQLPEKASEFHLCFRK